MLSRISRRSAQLTVAAAAGTTRAFGYQPRLREYQFLYDAFNLDAHYKALGREDINKDLVDTLLEENAKICTSVLAPLYMSGDNEGCHLGTDGNVTTPKGYKAAWDQMVEGGWVGFGAPEKYGGQGMPASLSGLQKEMVATANWAFGMYPGLAQGAITTLDTHGTEEQKEKFLRPMATGQWGGTMCLTEPHCGTDLGFCTTKAEPNADGTYKISGTKIFISSGDHDLTENIVHIVLAKLPNCPPGTKGLSLFIVPRHVTKADGTLEKKKNVMCAGLEKKMGIKANATAVLAFENSTGYLIGKEHDGMRMMFTFMNQARMGTAMQGVAHAELAFQNALAYTRERGSMRAMSGAKCPEKTQDPIIYHAPVKSAVCFAKCIAEAGRAFVLELAMLYDRVENAKDEKERKLWDDKMGILTPMAKGLLTELGLEAALQGQQCLGGHGFIKDNGMEQIVRDARISTLYEGTTGIQALDFIGRKVMLSKKDHLGAFQKQMIAVCKQHLWESGVLGQCSRLLMKRIMTTVVDTQRLKLRALKDREVVSSASVDYLYLNGYQAIGYYWLRLASAAKKKIDAGEDTDGFYKQKLDMCEYYFTVIFPRTVLHRQLMFNPSNVALKINNDMLDQ